MASLARHKQYERIWEIDLGRGIAIILMAVFHLVVDLKDFFRLDIDYLSGFWYYIGKLSASLFIFLAGVSCTLNKRSVRHALKVLAGALLVTIVTLFVDVAAYVRFGILHLLGVSILGYRFFSRIPSAGLLLIALVAVLLGPAVAGLAVKTSLLLPFGMMPAGFHSMDYYPLFPWLGVFLGGVAGGRVLYPSRKSLFRPIAGTGWLCGLGRHSLLFYLAHQPVMLGILWLVLG